MNNKTDNFTTARNDLERRHAFIASLLLYNQQIVLQLLTMSDIVSVFLPMMKKRYTCKKRRGSNKDHKAVNDVNDLFHSWNDTMFKRQFLVSRGDFYPVEVAIHHHKTACCGYDEVKHHKLATHLEMDCQGHLNSNYLSH